MVVATGGMTMNILEVEIYIFFFKEKSSSGSVLNYRVANEYLLFLTGLELWSLDGFPRENNPQRTFHSVHHHYAKLCPFLPFHQTGCKLHQIKYMKQLLLRNINASSTIDHFARPF